MITCNGILVFTEIQRWGHTPRQSFPLFGPEQGGHASRYDRGLWWLLSTSTTRRLSRLAPTVLNIGSGHVLAGHSAFVQKKAQIFVAVRLMGHCQLGFIAKDVWYLHIRLPLVPRAEQVTPIEFDGTGHSVFIQLEGPFIDGCVYGDWSAAASRGLDCCRWNNDNLCVEGRPYASKARNIGDIAVEAWKDLFLIKSANLTEVLCWNQEDIKHKVHRGERHPEILVDCLSMRPISARWNQGASWKKKLCNRAWEILGLEENHVGRTIVLDVFFRSCVQRHVIEILRIAGQVVKRSLVKSLLRWNTKRLWFRGFWLGKGTSGKRRPRC